MLSSSLFGGHAAICVATAYWFCNLGSLQSRHSLRRPKIMSAPKPEEKSIPKFTCPHEHCQSPSNFSPSVIFRPLPHSMHLVDLPTQNQKPKGLPNSTYLYSKYHTRTANLPSTRQE